MPNHKAGYHNARDNAHIAVTCCLHRAVYKSFIVRLAPTANHYHYHVTVHGVLAVENTLATANYKYKPQWFCTERRFSVTKIKFYFEPADPRSYLNYLVTSY